MSRLQSQKQGNGAQSFAFLEANRKAAADDTGFTAFQEQILDETEAMVNQRDEEITRIAKSIEELAAIFKELAVLVIDQGTILDRIDYNMEQVLENTKEGIVQLNKAEDYQKSALPVKCIIALVVLIMIMLLAMVLKHTAFKK
jgi:syntaxin 16